MQRRSLLAALGGSTALGPLMASAQTSAQTAAQTSAQTSAPQFKALGGERYQVGRIVVDKSAQRFTVPGRVHTLGKPLEYLATSPGGRKAYESLLELDASGTELNLACILIGLERDPSVPSWKPLGQAGQVGQVGQRVALSLAWTDSGQRRQVIAAEALLDAEARSRAAAVEWVYTGSFTSKDGSQLAADVTGTLISFVKKDPTGIIEAVSDISLGPYGSVRGSSLLPPEASAIELIVEAGKASK